MEDYQIYVCDTETSGLDSRAHDVIKVSFYRLSDNTQKTWCIKPQNPESIDPGALRINGHKLEDLLHHTQYGRDTYRPASEVIVEIENWLADDQTPSANRVLCGHNVPFDKDMLEQLWTKCNSKDTFPIGRRFIDTMIVEFYLNYCQGTMLDSYSLNAVSKKYSVKNAKAHSAEADTVVAKEVFLKQVEFFKHALANMPVSTDSAVST